MQHKAFQADRTNIGTFLVRSTRSKVARPVRDLGSGPLEHLILDAITHCM